MSSSQHPTLPRTFPLPHVSLAEAVNDQFRLTACIGRHFEGGQLLAADLGVVPGSGRPRTTARVERVLADYFGGGTGSAAALVQGAGTGALRAALAATGLAPGAELLRHSAPPYRTTATTLRGLGATELPVDFNDLAALRRAASATSARWALVQHSRQRLTDSYDPGAVLDTLRSAGLRCIVDDNYTAVRTPGCGTQLGAAASAFSLFKLHGPEGVGVVVGDADLIDRVHRENYSGGGQVQGHQALDGLRALVRVPVLWAVQSAVVGEAAARIAAGEVPGAAEVRIANAQDRSLVVRLTAPVAASVPAVAARFGAAPYPVGANSRYEIAPLFYRLSGSVLADVPELADWALRINPMRAGADQLLDILGRSLRELDVPARDGGSGGSPKPQPPNPQPPKPHPPKPRPPTSRQPAPSHPAPRQPEEAHRVPRRPGRP